MSGTFDLIALGETMFSLIALDGPVTTATTFRATHGGAESNTCVGFVRLGLRTAWVSRLGTDPLGDRIVAALELEGVDLTWVRRDANRPTGIMIRDTGGAVRYHRSESAASHLSPDDLEGVPIAEAGAVLVTGVTALIGAGPQRTALRLLDRAGGLRVVDPNLRAGLWGSDRAVELVRPLIERSDLLMGGEAELGTFVGESRCEDIARRCRELGPREIVIKRGSAGACVLDDTGWHEHRPSSTPDVDPVGAGDAFNAGYLAARLAGASGPEALVEGARCGASVASSVGDADGFGAAAQGRAGP